MAQARHSSPRVESQTLPELTPPAPPARGLKALLPFLAGVGLFYVGWLVVVTSAQLWAIVGKNWPIASAMAFGSFVAGSTPMGGGTVAFPVLVLGFDFPTTLGRDFSFCIQSVGMVSASAYILCRRQPLEWTMLKAGLLGTAIGTPLGIMYVAPLISGLITKVVYAVLWASFGVLHLVKLKELGAQHGILPTARSFDRVVGFAIGLGGGALVSSTTGVGIDMLIYMLLVLICQADSKIAIPTSVILMAFTSVVGCGTQMLRGALEPGVFEHWIAAAPVVALGAPLGAVAVNFVGRTHLLKFVSLLCVAQFIWTMHHESKSLGGNGMLLSMLAVAAANVCFFWLYRVGAALNRRGAQTTTRVANWLEPTAPLESVVVPAAPNCELQDTNSSAA